MARGTPPEPARRHGRDHPDGHFREILSEAALEAELETGRREETAAAARRHILVRIARVSAGTLVLLFGFAMLALPGPGLVTIAAGLALLSADVPFANRLLKEVRRRLPHDEDGRLPPLMVVSIVLGTVAAVVVSVWWAFLR